MQPAPARAGDPLDTIETPALCVDLDAFERNLDRMADATQGMRLRPHAKSHKCPDIARAQMLAIGRLVYGQLAAAEAAEAASGTPK